MIRRIRNSKITKIVSIFVLIIFIIEPFLGLRQVYALTGGPSQPEMAGFTPVDTDNMVDLFSGDFRYTIPLLTVPGPNGGYPVNLNYNSGIGMEHEASWVGLGWNLNPGAINRQVRGIPDDFSGDEIKKMYKQRNNNTFIFSSGGGGEVFGADFSIGLSTSASLVYNTYAGISISRHFGIAASYVRDRDIKNNDNGTKIATGNFGINLDSDNGITTSYGINGGSKNLRLGFNRGHNSKSGTYTFSSQISMGKVGIGSSFSTAANLPPIKIPLASNGFALSFQVGGAGAYLEGHGNVMTSVSIQETPDYEIVKKSYGLCYLENADENSLMDFNREKELTVNDHSLNLPLPVMTNDVYMINGELMGGSFRAYRSDYGHFYNNITESYTNTVNAGVNLAFGVGAHIGGSLGDTYSESFAGNWRDGYDDKIRYKNKNDYAALYPPSLKNQSPSLYEPFYFKMSGEQTASDPNHLSIIGGEQAVQFPLVTEFIETILGRMNSKYSISNILKSKNGQTIMKYYTQAARTKRTQNIEYKTGAEKGMNPQEKNRERHHIAEFSIVNADGERYTYGKTLYNYVEKEVQFSIQNTPYIFYPDSTTKTVYDRAWAKPETLNKNRVGKERLYSCTKTPGYAYSYLITQITSPDYVDITGDGPTEDDFGYWVKFSYNTVYKESNNPADKPYRWRFPYNGVNIFYGDPSNQTDDKGSYNYGTKEIAYLDTIATKTHFAIFHTSERKDALDAKDEFSGGHDNTSKALHRLDSIQLFSKADPSYPIKTVIFEYDYSLCKGTFNSVASGGNGKLTLKKVSFRYGADEKGLENPYEFTYHEFNPNYNPTNMDRWGNYKGNANYFEHYTSQDIYQGTPRETTDKWMSAWHLTEISLPSGGSIAIDYESDDYGYVQNKQAMYMAKIDPNTKFTKDGGKYYVCFKKESGIAAREYVKDFTNKLMFFKVAVRFQSWMPLDYIQGYVEINPDNVTDYGSYGKVEVKKFDAYDVHPIYFLCCQYLKNNRPDLLFGLQDADAGQSDAAAFFRSLVSQGIIAKAKAMYGNDKFYKYCLQNKLYQFTDWTNSIMPSYIRVNVPDKTKLGGGSRVKKITLYDNWEKSESSAYIQEYFYKKIDKNGKLISSGVAEYEPMVGAEETALRYPVYDQVKKLFFIEDEMYSEEPYGESYFPAANVGYSRITVRNTVPEYVNRSAPGIQVHEFYTAEDFPITVSQTALQREIKETPNILKILTAGFKQVSSSAYSQGYQIELNNMHGKQKSTAVYPHIPHHGESELLRGLNEVPFVSKVEYFYKTKTEGNTKKVNNLASVLIGDAETKLQILGQTYDFVIDQRENYSQSIGIGASIQFMLPIYFPSLPAFSLFPSFDSFEETVRSVATTKVIYNTGILEETVTTNKNAITTTTHLQWDPYTGQPLLTTVTNEFSKPVYNYNMPAYWQYPNMGNAAENYRAYWQSAWNNVPFLDDAFMQYDRISLNNMLVTMKDRNGTTVNYWLENSTSSNSINTIEVLRSRKSNQLNVMTTSTVSLSDPLSQRWFPMFDGFNSTGDTCFSFLNCDEKKEYTRIMNVNGYFYFFRTHSDPKICDYSIDSMLVHFFYVRSPQFPLLSPYPNDYCFTYNYGTTDSVNIYLRNNNGSCSSILKGSFPWVDTLALFSLCGEGILQASVSEFKSSGWVFNYADANIIPSLGSNKEHYLRIPNIYRSLYTNLFVTERKQTGSYNNTQYNTNAAYDGIFNFFSYYNYLAENAENRQKPWRWTAKVTKYSPFNFEIENKNPLNIYSAALYGYKQSLVTAVAQNARYCEIGFDSFENDNEIIPNRDNTRGHLKYGPGGTIDSTVGHTGNKSLLVSGSSGMKVLAKMTNKNFSNVLQDGWLYLVEDKNYVFSCWVRRANILTTDNLGKDYHIILGSGTFVTPNVKEPLVEGWQRIEFVFNTGNASPSETHITIQSPQYEGKLYFDDIRIMPANAIMKTYVYNPKNYRLEAELDENNYATFYNYDEENVLVQIKEETERGIMTLQTTRQNLKKQ
jgi:hypothetical protein